MAKITHRDVGDIWQPQATFTLGNPLDPDDVVATDPSELTLRIQDPDGSRSVTVEANPSALLDTSQPIARLTVGTYFAVQLLDKAGHWYCRFEGTGDVYASEDHEVIVDPSPFYDNGGVADYALVTLGETKDWLAEKQIDTSDDLKIVAGINAASSRISAVAGREFTPTAGERKFYMDGSWSKIDVGDLATLSSASTTATITSFETGAVARTLAETDYDGLPYNRKPWEPITTLRFRSTSRASWGSGYLLNITGYWGFPSVPEDIRHATMDAVAYWLDRDVEHFRQDLGTGGLGEAGQTVFLGGSPPTVFPLPPESYRIATSYRRNLVIG